MYKAELQGLCRERGLAQSNLNVDELVRSLLNWKESGKSVAKAASAAKSTLSSKMRAILNAYDSSDSSDDSSDPSEDPYEWIEEDLEDLEKDSLQRLCEHCGLSPSGSKKDLKSSLWKWIMKTVNRGTEWNQWICREENTKSELEDFCRTFQVPFSGRRKVELVLQLVATMSKLSRSNLNPSPSSNASNCKAQASKKPEQPKNVPESKKGKRDRVGDSDDDEAVPPKIAKTGTFHESKLKRQEKSKPATVTAPPKAVPSKAAPKASPKRPANTHFEVMTQDAYRRSAAKHDPSVVNDATEVCHVISSANGGANVRENYFMMNGALNRRLGARGDHVMAYLVGLPKTSLAVTASRALNGYEGDAYALYVEGEAFFRDAFGAQHLLHPDEHDPKYRLPEAHKYANLPMAS